MGSTRSTWDFYRGYQFSTTVTFVLIVMLLWLLSNMSKSAPREAKPLVVAILIAQLFNVVIGCEFFFAGPGVGGLIALCLAMAVIGLYRAEPALEQSDWSTHRAEITRWKRSRAWLRTSNSPMTSTSAPRSPKSGRGS